MENTNSTDERAALVAGLHELADFLADHPDLYFPSTVSWAVGSGADDEAGIQRIQGWLDAGFRDEWNTSATAGHHGVNVRFGSLGLRFSYIEDGKSRPMAWSKVVGESDKDFQARVDAALEATQRTENADAGTEETAEQAVCDRCSMPAIQIDGVWQHAEAADAAFCAIVMGGAK